jgi:hypothetical protein
MERRTTIGTTPRFCGSMAWFSNVLGSHQKRIRSGCVWLGSTRTSRDLANRRSCPGALAALNAFLGSLRVGSASLRSFGSELRMFRPPQLIFGSSPLAPMTAAWSALSSAQVLEKPNSPGKDRPHRDTRLPLRTGQSSWPSARRFGKPIEIWNSPRRLSNCASSI